MSKYTPQELYEEFRQFVRTLGTKEIYPEWEDAGSEGKKIFTQMCESMNRLAQEATLFEHHICVQKSEKGRETLAAFRARVPPYWNADFFELWDYEPDEFLFQFFRTTEPVNRFLIGPLCRGLPERIVEDEFNKKVEKEM